MADYAYDNLGRRTGLTRGNTTSTTWTWTASSRDWNLNQNLAGTAADATWWFTLNPAMQVRGRTLSNGTAYGDATATTGATAYVRDGLNRYASVGGTGFGYDARGNLTSDGARTYGYDVENRLTSIGGASTMTLRPSTILRLRLGWSPSPSLRDREETRRAATAWRWGWPGPLHPPSPAASEGPPPPRGGGTFYSARPDS